MALAAGFDEASIVDGYLRGPKDSLESTMDGVTGNHVWCSVKVDGEYRFVDCWLASPWHPQNEGRLESHWFLCTPGDMIYTHYPSEAADQYLEPPISITTFFTLPYVCVPFFWHHMAVTEYQPGCCDIVEDDQVCHLTLRVDPDVACYAEVETRSHKPTATVTAVEKTRGLAQCYFDSAGERLCKIKAVLPPDQPMGWLKIYAGPRVKPVGEHQQARQEKINSQHYPLALVFKLTRQHPPITDRARPAFMFVQLHVCPDEFYINEPQCYQLYPLQTYNFSIKSDHHHKLAIRSPGGKLFKLMYFPQDHIYNGSVTVGEAGQWSLICLLNHAGGWYVVASWHC
ncbi:hypothetical protein BCR43DRAFT_530080 [Syncephalastrum racemosum]|uniref:CYK3 C-terminal Ig-like domain-containing protein n=1 Tax=Syncephalastrum racemosum TaxID=13706 RepID=A0A1X2HIN8_SYNRA|nr:hypothetical protein BCR43DRAFT_530080 [Syncephalastrum racemosum]